MLGFLEDLSKYNELIKDLTKSFSNFYDIIDDEDRFYIYDQENKKYISKITSPRDGIVAYSPLLFTIKNNTLAFCSYEDDIRLPSSQQRLCEGILLQFYRDLMWIREGKRAKSVKTYRIVRHGNMSPEEMKRNTFIEYKDYVNDTKDYTDIIRSVCQLYHIFPGRKFYIYNLEEQVYKSVIIQERRIDGNTTRIPIEFVYENNKITTHTSVQDLDDYIINVFKTIYEDFFIRKTGATKYRLDRIDFVKDNANIEFEIAKPISREKKIEEKLIENHIKRDDEYFHHFFLRTCALDKNSQNILTKREGNKLIFIEFMYNNEDGLIATNVDLFELDISKVKQFEDQIIDGELIPIDIDEWNKNIDDKQRIDISLTPFNNK